MFVAGSEVTGERRVQLYTPDYLHTSKPRPVISLSPQQLVYGASFSINFTAVPDVDRVVLNRLTGSTHGNHFDQRQVVLACSPITGASAASCSAPPNSSIAPPGQYMLFILSQGIPSVANYVSLQFDDVASSIQPAG